MSPAAFVIRVVSSERPEYQGHLAFGDSEPVADVVAALLCVRAICRAGMGRFFWGFFGDMNRRVSGQ